MKRKKDYEFCPTCKAGAQYNEYGNIDVFGTTNRLIDLAQQGKMILHKGDCPLIEMNQWIENERKYTIVQFLQCKQCGNIIFWGVCIRGAPIYKVVDKKYMMEWDFE